MMWMNIRKSSIQLWRLLDPLYFRLTRLEYVQDTIGQQTIMRVRLTKYKGRDITLQDGTVIKKNDFLLKIHLHNSRLLKEIQGYNSDIRRAIIIIKSAQESLPAIAHYVERKNYADRIKGLIGITMLYKGCTNLGFETFPLKNPIYRKFKTASLLPIHLLATKQQLKEIPEPQYLFMSKAVLFDRYFSAPGKR